MTIKIKAIIAVLTAIVAGHMATAQSNIKYGEDYIVFDAEDTDTPLGSLWSIRASGDPTYLQHLDSPGASPDPVNNTYLQYVGPWQGAGSDLEYKFTCPKTGTYQVAMRMHSPLLEGPNGAPCGPEKNLYEYRCRTVNGQVLPWERGDKRNDCFIKMEGNFTSGSSKHTESDLRTFHKFFGRGENKWGSCVSLEHNGNNGVFYNLIEGEEYTFFLRGRSSTFVLDYIAFYDTSYLAHSIGNQSTDLAMLLPEDIRPYSEPTNISINPNSGDLRVGTSQQLETVMTPANGNPSATWSSSNSAIISVDQNGVITAEGTVGQTATITAISTIDNALIATSDITLVAFFNIPVTAVTVSPDQTTITENSTEQLTATILPTNADNKNVTWSSSDTNIATVDQNGNVTGVAEGSVKIRATSNENNTIFDEADITIGPSIPQAVSINKINGMTVADFKTSRSNKIEIGEVLAMEVSYSNITEFNSGTARVVVRYAINNGGTAVGPNLNIDNITVGGAEVTETVNYTVANHNTGNASETAVLQIFAAGNFGGINSLYSGFEIVPTGSLSTTNFSLDAAIMLYPNPTKDFFTLEKKSSIKSLNMALYTISGALIKTSTITSHKQTISTNQLKSGIYILQLESDTATSVKRLIVE